MALLWSTLVAVLLLDASLLVAFRLRAISELQHLMHLEGIRPNPLRLGDLLALRLLKYRDRVSVRERALIQGFAATWMMLHILLVTLLFMAFVIGLD